MLLRLSLNARSKVMLSVLFNVLVFSLSLSYCIAVVVV